MMMLVAGVVALTGASLAVFCLLVWRAPGETYPGQFDRSVPDK